MSSSPTTSNEGPSLATTTAVLSHFQSIRQSITDRLVPSKQQPKPAFPPESWFLQETKNTSAGSSDWSYGDPSVWTKEIEQLKTEVSIDDTVSASQDLPAEPFTIADRIRDLIPSLPLPALGSTSSHLADTFNLPADSKLSQLLRSEPIMNGSGSEGRKSIWSILEKLGPKKQPIDTKKHEEKTQPSNNSEAGSAVEIPDSGIMLYAPLQPTPESELELADSDVVLEYVDEPNPDGSAPRIPDEMKPTAAKPTVIERREWHPSRTKLSLQAAWWGYRLYLPPPVVHTLSDAHLAAAKRGAIVTASLKWLLDKIPMSMIPPQFRPAVMILKRLTPYLGYVGAFIAWSWERVKKKDKGNGVVLTATWLLPLAVIPATWDLEARSQPKPPKIPKQGEGDKVEVNK